MSLLAFPPCLGIEVQSAGVKPNKHGGVGAKWRCIYWSPLCFSPRWRLTSIRNQQPPSLCVPAVPSPQLSCICGAVTVRGTQQTHSLQPCWLEGALYLLWDRLWTCQTDSYFCLFSQRTALLGCLSMGVCTRCYSTRCYFCHSTPIDKASQHLNYCIFYSYIQFLLYLPSCLEMCRASFQIAANPRG